MPSDEPPPYTEIASHGSVTVSEGAGVPIIRQDTVQTTRPSSQNSQASAQSSSTHQSNFAPPPGPPPRTHQPPPGPPPGPPPSSSSSSSGKHQYSEKPQFRPPPGPPHKQQHYRPPSPEHFHAPHPNSYAPPPQHMPPQHGMMQPPPPQGRPHLRYPKGYHCKKCNNTGIKVKNGKTCQDCFDRFGVRAQAQYLPPGAMPVFNGPPRVVQPGDPSIGGWLCGRCRGTGIIRDFLLFESTCPVCHGVGRVF